MKARKFVTVVFTLIAFFVIGVVSRPIKANAADPMMLTANDGTIYISYDGISWERYSPSANGYVCTSPTDKSFTWKGTGPYPYYNGSEINNISQYYYNGNWYNNNNDLKFWCDYFAASYGFYCKSYTVEYTTYSTDSWSKTTVYYY